MKMRQWLLPVLALSVCGLTVSAVAKGKQKPVPGFGLLLADKITSHHATYIRPSSGDPWYSLDKREVVDELVTIGQESSSERRTQTEVPKTSDKNHFDRVAIKQDLDTKALFLARKSKILVPLAGSKKKVPFTINAEFEIEPVHVTIDKALKDFAAARTVELRFTKKGMDTYVDLLGRQIEATYSEVISKVKKETKAEPGGSLDFNPPKNNETFRGRFIITGDRLEMEFPSGLVRLQLIPKEKDPKSK
jgi:hypothetical protein